jgi:hypothetical protein
MKLKTIHSNIFVLLILLLSLGIILCSSGEINSIDDNNSIDNAENNNSNVDNNESDDDFTGFGLVFDKQSYEKTERSISPKFLRRSVTPLESKIDLSNKMPEAGKQGKQNSCVGWAVGYAYRSYQRLRENNQRWDYDDDELCSPAYIYNTLNLRKSSETGQPLEDRGTSVESAMKLLMEDGCLPMSIMPYDESDFTKEPPDGYNDLQNQFRIPSYQRLTQNFGDKHFEDKDLQQIKAALSDSDNNDGVPVEMSILVDRAWDRYITNDRFSEKNFTNDAVHILNKTEAERVRKNYENGRAYGHAVLIVGYDDNFTIEYTNASTKETMKEKGAFRILNSWGSDWADDGYFWMTYDAAKTTGMEAYRIGKNPDLPDVEGKEGMQVGMAMTEALSLGAKIEKKVFGNKIVMVSKECVFNSDTGFFRVDYDFEIDTKFRLYMRFNDEYSVYVLNITPDGRIRELFPYPDNEEITDVSNWVYAGQEYIFPPRDNKVYSFKPDGPTGRELYVVILSDRQLTYDDVVQTASIPNIDSIQSVDTLIEKALPKLLDDDTVLVYPVILNTE